MVAAATLAIGSAALAAAPATAATPTGITRVTVLTAAAGIRAADVNDTNRSPETNAAIDDIVTRECSLTADDEVGYTNETVVEGGGSADGLLIVAAIGTQMDESWSSRYCIISALAVVDPTRSLQGSLSVTLNDEDQDTTTFMTLSGDVSVKSESRADDRPYLRRADVTAIGGAVIGIPRTTTKRVDDRKSPAVKKAARKAYEKEITAAKKARAKAFKKADGSTAKKAAARATYAARKAAAKSLFLQTIDGYKTVAETTYLGDSVPFTLTAS